MLPTARTHAQTRRTGRKHSARRRPACGRRRRTLEHLLRHRRFTLCGANTRRARRGGFQDDVSHGGREIPAVTSLRGGGGGGGALAESRFDLLGGHGLRRGHHVVEQAKAPGVRDAREHRLQAVVRRAILRYTHTHTHTQRRRVHAIQRSVSLSVPWHSCLGYGHAGCPQLSHRRPPEMCGLWTRPRTDVDPPRF